MRSLLSKASFWHAVLRFSFFFGIFFLCAAFTNRYQMNSLEAPRITGGWSQTIESDGGEITHLLLFCGDYYSWTSYRSESGAFIQTKGGSLKKDGKKLTMTYEFNTLDSSLVGTSETWKLRLKKGELKLRGAGSKKVWRTVENGVSTPLEGAWLFSGRKRNGVGELSRRDTNRPRKTMKLLTGSRFQWIAYNTETKQFMGTGGGSYIAKNGVYTENIEFFSRDDKRVGASLNFEFDVKGEDWHHSGKSSKGDPMYEIWSKRK